MAEAALLGCGVACDSMVSEGPLEAKCPYESMLYNSRSASAFSGEVMGW